jgi:hypothetical protein
LTASYKATAAAALPMLSSPVFHSSNIGLAVAVFRLLLVISSRVTADKLDQEIQ